MTFDNEFIFKSKQNIQYLLFEEDSDYLAIIFSGYSKDKAYYNYINCIKDIKCNKLYILDNYGFNNAGCWYLCENMNFEIEQSTIHLIDSIVKKLNIKYKNVISLGSSKGGFASIYYGIKYKFGHIIAAGPQVLLGEYLDSNSLKNVFLSMVGNDLENGKNILNNAILNLTVSKINKFYIFCGLDDYHLKAHVYPLLINLSKYNNSIFLDIYDGKHSDIGEKFSPKLKQVITNIINNNVIFTKKEDVELFIDENINISNINKDLILENFTIENLDFHKIKLYIKPFNIGLDYTVSLYTDDAFINYATNTLNPIFILYLDKIDTLYYIYYTIKDKNHKVTIKITLDLKSFNYNILEVTDSVTMKHELNINNFKIFYTSIDSSLKLNLIDNNYYDDISYAFYILKDTKIIDTIYYTKKNELNYLVKESGSYNIVYFIKDNIGNIIYNQTSSLNVIVSK